MLSYYRPVSSLSLRERVGERGSDKSNCLYLHPLSLALPLRGRGRIVYRAVSGLYFQLTINVFIVLFLHDFITLKNYFTRQQ